MNNSAYLLVHHLFCCTLGTFGLRFSYGMYQQIKDIKQTHLGMYGYIQEVQSKLIVGLRTLKLNNYLGMYHYIHIVCLENVGVVLMEFELIA